MFWAIFTVLFAIWLLGLAAILILVAPVVVAVRVIQSRRLA